MASVTVGKSPMLTRKKYEQKRMRGTDWSCACAEGVADSYLLRSGVVAAAGLGTGQNK